MKEMRKILEELLNQGWGLALYGSQKDEDEILDVAEAEVKQWARERAKSKLPDKKGWKTSNSSTGRSTIGYLDEHKVYNKAIDETLKNLEEE